MNTRFWLGHREEWSCPEPRWKRTLVKRLVGFHQEFRLGHVKSVAAVEWAGRYVSLEFRGQAWMKV